MPRGIIDPGRHRPIAFVKSLRWGGGTAWAMLGPGSTARARSRLRALPWPTSLSTSTSLTPWSGWTCAPLPSSSSTRSLVSSACTSWPWKTPWGRISVPSWTGMRRICSCPATACGWTSTMAAWRRPRSTPSSASAGSLPSVRATSSRSLPCWSVGTVRPTLPPTGCRSCSTAFSMLSSTATSMPSRCSMTTTRRSARASSRNVPLPLPTAALV